MFTSNDILDRLRSGESVDDIMNDITAIMTEATKTYEDEEANKNLKNAKIKAMYSIITNIYNYILDFCIDSDNSVVVDFVDTVFEQITPEDMVERVDKLIEEFKNDPMTKEMIKYLNNEFDSKNFYDFTVHRDTPVKLSKSDDEVLNEFLKSFNLK